ncbi:sporulation protein YtxC [Oceanobacillus sp. CAU 1775]
MKYQAVADSFVNVYLNFYFSSVLIEIIKDKYYFSDKHVIQHIHELAEWIITGEDADSIMIRQRKHPIQLLRAIFLMHIRNTTTLHFDSIVKFGMKIFKEELIHYVGLAIDEFKREEEHQSFIQTLREFIKKKESTVPLIHVLEGENFNYFNEQGRPFSKTELITRIKKDPLILFGLSQKEWNLTPLIALAPDRINLYVHDPSHPKIQTVINVFQERVAIRMYDEFPFSFVNEI